MCGYADILFDLKRAICFICCKLYLFKNIISCYLTVLKEICAKYQIACNKLEFCYQNLESDARGWGDSSVLHARHSLGLCLFRLEFDLSSICSYLLYFSQRHDNIASVRRYFLRSSWKHGGQSAWVIPGEMRKASQRRWCWSCCLQEDEETAGRVSRVKEAQKQSLWGPSESGISRKWGAVVLLERNHYGMGGWEEKQLECRDPLCLLFSHSFSKRLLSSYYVPSLVLDTGTQ